MRTLWALAAALAAQTFAVEASAQTTGNLVVVTDPPGADVTIDGDKAGQSPLKKAVLPGDHLVEAKWPQGKASQIVKVAEGQSALVNLSPPAGATPPPPTAPPAPVMPPVAPTTPPPVNANQAQQPQLSRVEGNI